MKNVSFITKRTRRIAGILLLPALLILAGCATPVPTIGNLEQAPPRKLAKSLKLPAAAEPGFVIAGLAQGAVPQGLSLLPGREVALTSHYFDNGLPSCLVATALESGKATGTFHIREPDGDRHTGHVGGLAAAGTNLWIASDQFLYRGGLDVFAQRPGGGDFQTLEKIRTEAYEEVAFCAVFDGLVWAGEFALKIIYPTPAEHHMEARDGDQRYGWVCGYDLEKGFNHPVRVLSVPDRAQGIYAWGDYIFLSLSYGRRYRSSVEIYRNPLSEKPHIMAKTRTGEDVPLWFLDDQNLVRSIDLPPMTENIVVHNGELLVLIESGAKKFRWFGKAPVDRMIHLKLNELDL